MPGLRHQPTADGAPGVPNMTRRPVSTSTAETARRPSQRAPDAIDLAAQMGERTAAGRCPASAARRTSAPPGSLQRSPATASGAAAAPPAARAKSAVRGRSGPRPSAGSEAATGGCRAACRAVAAARSRRPAPRRRSSRRGADITLATCAASNPHASPRPASTADIHASPRIPAAAEDQHVRGIEAGHARHVGG